jgi:hypothetical protein
VRDSTAPVLHAWTDGVTGTGALTNDQMRVAAGAARTLALVGAALVGSTTGRVVSSPIDMNAVFGRNLTAKSCASDWKPRFLLTAVRSAEISGHRTTGRRAPNFQPDQERSLLFGAQLPRVSLLQKVEGRTNGVAMIAGDRCRHRLRQGFEIRVRVFEVLLNRRLDVTVCSDIQLSAAEQICERESKDSGDNLPHRSFWSHLRPLDTWSASVRPIVSPHRTCAVSRTPKTSSIAVSTASRCASGSIRPSAFRNLLSSCASPR